MPDRLVCLTHSSKYKFIEFCFGINLGIYSQSTKILKQKLFALIKMWTNERWCFRMLFFWASLLINKHHIPIVISYRKDKVQKTWGSRRAKAKFQQFYSGSLSMKKSFTEDQNELNCPGTSGHIPDNPENVYVRQVLENRSGDELPAKLPSKLSLCRLRQLGTYIERMFN